MRRLLVTRRHVPLDVGDDYLEAWEAVARATATAGGRAWIFRSSTYEDRFLEFIEWTDPAAPPDDDGVAAARSRLDGFAPASDTHEWEEAT